MRRVASVTAITSWEAEECSRMALAIDEVSANSDVLSASVSSPSVDREVDGAECRLHQFDDEW